MFESAIMVGASTMEERIENSTINFRAEGARRWIDRGLGYLDDDSYDAALHAFSKAYEIDPDSPDAILNLAQELYMQGRFEESEKMVRRGLKIKPGVEMYRILAAILLEDGNRVEEISSIVKNVRETCGDKHSADLLEAHYQLEKNNLEKSIYLFQSVLDSEPENEEALEGVARALNLLGIDKSEAGFHSEAVFLFKKALRLDPRWSAPHVNLGNCYSSLGKIESAINAYLDGIELEPDNPQAHFNLARILVEQNRFDEAESELIDVLEIDPHYPDAHAELGQIQNYRGKFLSAIDHFQKELDLNPESVPCLCNMAIACICCGKASDGEEMLKRALKIKEDPFTLYTLAGLYASLQRDTDSLSMLERAARYKPSWLPEYLRADEKFDRFKTNPRFVEMLSCLADSSPVS